jgi:hypothetical protein
MPAQRKLPLLLDGVAGLPAAAQHDLPKAVIELGQIGLNPNRSFAASAADVSHADQSAIGCNSAPSAFLKTNRS